MKVILNKKLKEIITSHDKWLHTSGIDGEKANFRHADLRGVDFSGVDLRYADFTGANLRNAIFCVSNLSNAEICCADLRCADFSGADLDGTKLSGADLCATKFNKTYYQIVRIGSRNATTTYCVEDDTILCGCWNDYEGGTLEEFRNRVKSTYGVNGYRPNKKFYTQYMAAIEFFEKMKELTKA